MWKKIAIGVLLILPVLGQASFLYSRQHGGAESYTELWRSFGVEQTSYSQFVFRTAIYWWALPVLSACVALFALTQGGAKKYALSVVLGCAGYFALVWSAYSPVFMAGA